MIPRYQTVLFVILLVASVVMGGVLWRLRERAHDRLIYGQDSLPTQAPLVAPSEQATLLVANDTDNSLLPQTLSLPLPESPGARAHAVLGKLLEIYAAPNAVHPVPGGPTSIAEVFLLPVSTGDAAENARAKGEPYTGPELAVVNLTGAFTSTHPSGLETETLTVLSICATLHANLPRVTEVRFLVDGQPRATLSGHADLTRTYLAADTAPTEGSHPQ